MHFVPPRVDHSDAAICILYLILSFYLHVCVSVSSVVFAHCNTPPPDFDVLFYIVCIPPLAALLIALWGYNSINLEFIMKTCVIYDEL